jgi:uncharacterized protein (TIGR00296 family)
MMLNLDEGTQAAHLARDTVESFVQTRKEPTPVLKGPFKEKRGVFVTLHTYPTNDLRGCIGIPHPVMPLQEAIVSAAVSATQDPRFPPLGSEELDTIIVEVTVLTPPVLIKVSSPKDYVDQIVIGRDGLIVEQGFYKGLLLPQVPVEQGWDKEDFLSQTCLKACLLPDAWYDPLTKIYRFSGQIFAEHKPRGEVKEKHLDGSSG